MNDMVVGQQVVVCKDVDASIRGGNAKERRSPTMHLNAGSKVTINRFSKNGNVHVFVAVDSRKRMAVVPKDVLCSREEYNKVRAHNDEVMAHAKNRKYDDAVDVPVPVVSSPTKLESLEEDVKPERTADQISWHRVDKHDEGETINKEAERLVKEAAPKPHPIPSVPTPVLSAQDERIQWIWTRVRGVVDNDTYNAIANELGLRVLKEFTVSVPFGGLHFTTKVDAVSREEAEELALQALIAGVEAS